MDKKDSLFNFYNYDFMEQRIGAPSNNYLHDYYLKIAKNKNTNEILELGYGSGFLTKILLENNFQVTAIDRSHEAKIFLQNKCSKYESKNHLIINETDILDFKTKKKFNLIIAADEFIKHFLSKVELKIFLKKVNSLLNENGVFVTDVRINKGEQFNKINYYPISPYTNSKNGIEFIICSSWNILAPDNIVLVHFKYEEMNSKGEIINSYIKILRQGLITSDELKSLAKEENLELERREEINLDCDIYTFTKSI